MSSKVAECAVCGKMFHKKCGVQKYCSHECGKKIGRMRQIKWSVEHGKGYLEQERRKRSAEVGREINDINAEAEKAGMSYGIYVALRGL